MKSGRPSVILRVYANHEELPTNVRPWYFGIAAGHCKRLACQFRQLQRYRWLLACTPVSDQAVGCVLRLWRDQALRAGYQELRPGLASSRRLGHPHGRHRASAARALSPLWDPGRTGPVGAHRLAHDSHVRGGGPAACPHDFHCRRVPPTRAALDYRHAPHHPLGRGCGRAPLPSQASHHRRRRGQLRPRPEQVSDHRLGPRGRVIASKSRTIFAV